MRRQWSGAARFRWALWIAAVLLAALALAACGDDDDDDGGGGSGGGTDTGSQQAELDLHTDGQLTVGAEFPVKGFLELPIDDPKGFEVDFADALAEQMGVPKVQWVSTPFAGLFSPGAQGLRHGDQRDHDHARALQGRRLQRPLLRRQPGLPDHEGRPGRGRDVDRRHEGPPVRLPGRHHRRRLHQRQDPAEQAAARVLIARRRRAGARQRPDRRLPDGRRDRLGDRQGSAATRSRCRASS